jgi:uncharacterized protein YcnI
MASDTLPVSASYAVVLDDLKSRCTANNIEYDQVAASDGTPRATLQFPSGKDNKRTIIVGSEVKAKLIQAINFEEFVFIPGFEAIWSYPTPYVNTVTAKSY